jgi:hypothetical protein
MALKKNNFFNFTLQKSFKNPKVSLKKAPPENT